MALLLSVDEWVLISDFLQAAALSRTCLRTWTILHSRHQSWKTNPHDIAQMTMGVAAEMSMRSLTVQCTDFQAEGAQALAALHQAPSLTALHLNLMSNSVGDDGAQALAALKATPALTDLTLRLRYNDIGPAGAGASPPFEPETLVSGGQGSATPRDRVILSGRWGFPSLAGAMQIAPILCRRRVQRVSSCRGRKGPCSCPCEGTVRYARMLVDMSNDARPRSPPPLHTTPSLMENTW